jgi:hypothetical protein
MNTHSRQNKAKGLKVISDQPSSDQSVGDAVVNGLIVSHTDSTLIFQENHSLPSRGISNPKVIDLVQVGADSAEQIYENNTTSLANGLFSNTVELHIVQEKEWEEYGEELLLHFEEKLNNYTDYVLDGFFARDYPLYRSKKIVIVFSLKSVPPEPVARLIEAFTRFATPFGIFATKRFELV